MLPPVAVAENNSRAKLVRARAGSDSRAIQVFAGGLCGHARSRAFANQRASEVRTVGGVKGTQAAGFPRFAEEETQGCEWAVADAVHGRWFRIGPLLASTLYDFNVYSSHKVREKLEYMHANPVKRGLVKNPSAWMWSSFLFYEKGQAGLVKIDPLG